jgi:hypothetical protein
MEGGQEPAEYHKVKSMADYSIEFFTVTSTCVEVITPLFVGPGHDRETFNSGVGLNKNSRVRTNSFDPGSRLIWQSYLKVSWTAPPLPTSVL